MGKEATNRLNAKFAYVWIMVQKKMRCLPLHVGFCALPDLGVYLHLRSMYLCDEEGEPGGMVGPEGRCPSIPRGASSGHLSEKRGDVPEKSEVVEVT